MSNPSPHLIWLSQNRRTEAEARSERMVKEANSIASLMVKTLLSSPDISETYREVVEKVARENGL